MRGKEIEHGIGKAMRERKEMEERNGEEKMRSKRNEVAIKSK